MFETTKRRYGYSVFGEKVRWATFPSIAAGWAFSEEPFLKHLYWLSFGKVRVSWGKSGQKFGQRYLAHGLMTSSGSFFGTSVIVPVTDGVVINLKHTCEETSQYDVGLDFSLFDNRLKVTTDYYYRYKDYIKNVESSEIYATWPDDTIRANILAIMSFTLNRVYTEWYRNKGKDFTITSSTA